MMRSLSSLTRRNAHMAKTISAMKLTISNNEMENERLMEEIRLLRDELCDANRSYSDHVKSTAELRQAIDRLSAEKSKWLRRKD